MSEERRDAEIPVEEVSNDDDNRIEISGSIKWATQDAQTAYRVISGSVYVYVMYITSKKPGRHLYLCECGEGDVVPSMLASDTVYGCGWLFYMTSAASGDKAVLERFTPKEDADDIRKAFLQRFYEEKNTLPPEEIKCDQDSFNSVFTDYYRNTLESEKRAIGAIGKDRAAASASKTGLIQSVFTRKNLRRYESGTASPLYNLMSVYCDYMNLQMCSYRSLNEIYGDNFTVNDIARISHFVARKVTLSKNWYRKRGSAFITNYKDTGKPVLCIPQGRRGYFAYDTESGCDIRVTAEVAERLEEEVTTIYQRLSSKSMTLKEVLRFGIDRIESGDIAVFITMYILVTLVGLLLPLLNEQMFDKLIPMGQETAIYQVGFVILAFMIGNIFFSLVQNLSSFRAIKTMEYNIVSATYARIFRLPQQFIDSISSTELVNRANSVSTVFASVVSSGVTAVTGAVLSLFYLYRMFRECKVLAWRGLIMAVISGVVMYIFGRLRISRERSKLEYSTRANGKLYHYIAGILKIKVSGLETRSLYEYEKDNVESVRSNVNSVGISNIGTVFTTIMSMVYTGVIYYVVVKKNQELTIGEYAAFNSAYGLFTSAITQLVNFFITNATLVPVMDRIRPIYEQEAETPDRVSTLGRLKGHLEVAHLEFSYDEEDEPALKDISFKVNPGEFIGIVGPSGCGKSTLLKCLLGFENATKGNIFYDSRDISTLDKCELRRQMGVVLQDGQLVVGNIFTNVTLSAPNMEADEAMELLKEVGLYEDVDNMPMGIFTSISEGGGTVSGGQKQRILIARAIANNPSILFMDEATSALDNITQQKVCESLKDRNITRVMIAHRLSTVRDCDRILVMDKGRIVEEGNFDELIDKKGLFYELARRQQIE